LGADHAETDVVVPVVGIIVVAGGAAQVVIVIVPRAAAKGAGSQTALFRISKNSIFYL
jgi:hypothetical protein